MAVRRHSELESASRADGDEAPAATELRLDRVGGPETLPELLAESDFIVLAAPLTPETEDMINADTLAMVKPGRLADQRGPRPADR